MTGPSRIVRDKRALRARLRDRLAALGAAERVRWSELACAAVVAAPRYATARRVAAFLSMADEIETRPLLQRALGDGKHVCVPSIEPAARAMRFVTLVDLEDLAEGPHGIAVPRRLEPVPAASIDLVIVPGLAFDPAGGRLGRGAGYYDRVLASLDRDRTIGFAFELQVVERVPCEEHDRRVGALATERGLRGCDGGAAPS